MFSLSLSFSAFSFWTILLFSLTNIKLLAGLLLLLTRRSVSQTAVNSLTIPPTTLTIPLRKVLAAVLVRVTCPRVARLVLRSVLAGWLVYL